jgi:methionine-R-sulfoxide reductase
MRMQTKKQSEEELKVKLTPLQFDVTQKCGTEEPFANEYWDNKREDIRRHRQRRAPLSSKDKFDSGTGWPSFTRLLEKENAVERKDRSLGILRTEIRAKEATASRTFSTTVRSPRGKDTA